MAANAAADSGAFLRVAANTSDQRVWGNTRGASLDEVWLLMEKIVSGENYPKRSECYRRSVKKLGAPASRQRSQVNKFSTASKCRETLAQKNQDDSPAHGNNVQHPRSATATASATPTAPSTGGLLIRAVRRRSSRRGLRRS